MASYTREAEDVATVSTIASLETIQLEVLRNGSRTESERLLRACRNDGFFYLDMTDAERKLDEAVEDIFALERELFSLPQDELMNHDIDKLSSRKLNGYKPLGRNRGGLEGGRDGFESYALPKDGILDLSSSRFQRPDIVTAHLASLRTFCSAVSTAATTLLTTLSTLLQIPPNTPTLQSLHPSHLPTPDMVRLLKYHTLSPSERGTTHIAHTDLGSLTFLYRTQYGLQVQRPKPAGSKEECWEWVKPPAPGHAIVNLGDGLSMLTRGYLKSCLHRVIPYPGDEIEERYSFAYFMRAEDQVVMRALKSPLFGTVGADRSKEAKRGGGKETESEEMTSAQWLQKKYTMLRKDTWNKEKEWILTGVKEGKDT
ncbi:MAG: hypothetical protein Q9217_006662 [Psora testacea]